MNKGVLIVAGMGTILLAQQADELARMMAVELGRGNADPSELTRAQWSGFAQAARNRAIRRKTVPSQAIHKRRESKGGGPGAVWTNAIEEYEEIMDRQGPGSPAYLVRFVIAVKVLLGMKPYVDIGKREGFIHPKTQTAQGLAIPEWARGPDEGGNADPMKVGITRFV